MPKTDGTTISTSLASGFCTLARKREQDSETQSERERAPRKAVVRTKSWMAATSRALSLSCCCYVCARVLRHVCVCETACVCVCALYSCRSSLTDCSKQSELPSVVGRSTHTPTHAQRRALLTLASQSLPAGCCCCCRCWDSLLPASHWLELCVISVTQIQYQTCYYPERFSVAACLPARSKRLLVVVLHTDRQTHTHTLTPTHTQLQLV